MTVERQVRLGMAIPQVFLDGAVDMALVRRVVQRAEALGFESLWATEGILTRTPSLDPLVLLSYAAALTVTSRLGVSVLVFPLHSPVHVARRIGSLDRVSGGRAILGLGLGRRTAPYGAFGLTPARRAARFEEGVQVLKALWTRAETEYEGEFCRLKRATMEPKPIQRPHPPIWLGGHHPNALRRAVRLADGWMGAGGASVREFVQSAEAIHRLMEAANRSPESFVISKRLYVAVDPDETRAVRELRRWFGVVYRDPELAMKVAVWGSRERCAEVINELVSTGANHVLLHPVYSLEAQLEALAELAGFAS
jgi:probable F420-dependent oxidoreductase